MTDNRAAEQALCRNARASPISTEIGAISRNVEKVSPTFDFATITYKIANENATFSSHFA